MKHRTPWDWPSPSLFLAAAFVTLSASVGCASTPPPLTPAAAPAATTSSADGAPGGVEVTALCGPHCEAAEVMPIPARVEQPDHHAAAVANANQIFAAMHKDLLACYKSRVAVSPTAHAFMTIDVVINPDGSIRAVETTGGALLGDKARQCIVNRVQRATFAPVRDGGTLRIHVPVSLRKLTPDESI